VCPQVAVSKITESDRFENGSGVVRDLPGREKERGNVGIDRRRWHFLVPNPDQESVDRAAMSFGLTAVFGFEGVAVLPTLIAEVEVEPTASLL